MHCEDCLPNFHVFIFQSEGSAPPQNIKSSIMKLKPSIGDIPKSRDFQKLQIHLEFLANFFSPMKYAVVSASLARLFKSRVRKHM